MPSVFRLPSVLRSLLWAGLATLLILTPSLASIQAPDPDTAISQMEQGFETEFNQYFNRRFERAELSTQEMAEQLQQLQDQTGIHPAILWATVRDDRLRLTALTAQNQPIIREFTDIPRSKIRRAVRSFHRDLVTQQLGHRLTSAQRLHRWLIEPLETEVFQAEGIDTLLLCFSKDLRGLPVAALHDGDRFLIEKYNLTQIPAFSLLNPNLLQEPPAQQKVLAMGVSEFSDQEPLPAVPLELSAIVQELQNAKAPATRWQGNSFLNETFTLDNLKQWLQSEQYNIVHLATHAAFKPGRPEQSALHLWDRKLSLNEMKRLPWGNLDLLVLSACTTAVGDEEAELGFAGLALQAGANSAVASLWNVSDAGTLALMSEFYSQLPRTPLKVQALRQAQLRMLHGEVRFEAQENLDQGKQLRLSRGAVELPETLNSSSQIDLSNPYYWAGFLMLSNP